jgi:hypothetical protein
MSRGDPCWVDYPLTHGARETLESIDTRTLYSNLTFSNSDDKISNSVVTTRDYVVTRLIHFVGFSFSPFKGFAHKD